MTALPSVELVVDYLRLPEPRRLHRGDHLYLDRKFLSDPTRPDHTLSRRPHAPCLRFRDAHWWLDNDCLDDSVPLTVFSADLGRRFNVPNQCSFRLRNGESELHLWRPEFRVLLLVHGQRTRPADPEPSGPVTEVGRPDADARVLRLFAEKPWQKVILAAHYREYFTPGIKRPAETSRAETARCIGRKEHDVSEAKKAIMEAIWGEQGHGDEIASYLIGRMLITRQDQSLVPHRECSHRRPRRAT
jgi:hypothetical protein